jgi:hypothetical protein
MKTLLLSLLATSAFAAEPILTPSIVVYPTPTPAQTVVIPAAATAPVIPVAAIAQVMPVAATVTGR